MAKIKICGLSRRQDIEYVNELKPDYIGYVFWEKSRRHVTKETAEALTELLLPNIVPVGVFVDADLQFVASLLNEGIIKIAQLHGGEDEEYVGRLKELTDKPLIKAFKVRETDDVRRANSFPTDYVMLDNGYGTGKTFDWTYLKLAERPYFLAGGLDAYNVREVISKINPFAVDVSSGVETDGHKDYGKIRDFMRAAVS